MTHFQNTCLQLAKSSILEEFGKAKISNIKLEDKEFKQQGACFVTLKKNGTLRGCIGSIIPHRSLETDIKINARNAAFEDPRFPPVTSDEIENNNFHIGITILSPMQERIFKNSEELITFLEKERCGLVIKFGYRQATFLPSVWEEVPQAQEFLALLIQKAGIGMDEFNKFFKEIEFHIYYGQEFGKDRKKI